ncbi:MAG: hypothetical protein IKX75_03090 [Desulfovibrio sp.]|nr:hypothetical protein [Desulfovibrio sp.]
MRPFACAFVPVAVFSVWLQVRHLAGLGLPHPRQLAKIAITRKFNRLT